MAYVGTSYITYPKRDDTTLMSTAKKEKGDPLVMTNLLYMHRGGCGPGQPVASTGLISHNDFNRKLIILLLSDFNTFVVMHNV